MSADACCISTHDRLANWGQSFRDHFNKGVDKVSGKTFEFVEKLKLSDSDSTFAKIGKVFAAFLGCATIVPFVGLFVASGTVKLLDAIRDKFRHPDPAPAAPSDV